MESVHWTKAAEVDDALRQFLKAVDEYQTASAEVVASCKSGVFDIAQARKAMGGKGIGVSQIHYPARMRARATIHVQGEQGGAGETMRLKIRDGPLPPGKPRRDENDEEGEDLGADRDPIKWFGLLVPSHLRTSQATFKRGLESAVCAAKATVEMRGHYERYLELKRAL